jgi:formate hydrogenlyase subunit 3/multisubunit Na+/H+ antiporter MnhD subunit
VPEAEPGRLRRVGGFVARHEGIAFTLGYLALATIGMLHLAAFYAEFRINVLQFAEVSDFLLAPVRDPFVVLVTILPLPVFALMNWLSRVSERGWHRLRKSRPDPARVARDRRLTGILSPIAFVLWVLAFNLRYVDMTTDGIKAGHGKQVEATLTDGRSLAEAPDSTVTLLPGTARFAFFYRVAQRDLVIVPIDNLRSVSIAVPPPRRRGEAR